MKPSLTIAGAVLASSLCHAGGAELKATKIVAFKEEVQTITSVDSTEWKLSRLPLEKRRCTSFARRIYSETIAAQSEKLERQCKSVAAVGSLIATTDKQNVEVSDVRYNMTVNCENRSIGETFLIEVITKCEKLIQSGQGEISRDWEAIGCSDVIAKAGEIQPTEFEDVSKLECALSEL